MPLPPFTIKPNFLHLQRLAALVCGAGLSVNISPDVIRYNNFLSWDDTLNQLTIIDSAYYRITVNLYCSAGVPNFFGTFVNGVQNLTNSIVAANLSNTCMIMPLTTGDILTFVVNSTAGCTLNTLTNVGRCYIYVEQLDSLT